MQELFNDKYQGKISTLIEIFADAENKIKSIERETSELSIPSVNQLRYVAYHLIEILKNSENIDEELDKAINHAKRAKYDVLEISCLYYLEEIKEFQDNYSQYTETIDILPEYINLHAYIQSNAVGFLNILEGCRNHGVKNIAYASQNEEWDAKNPEISRSSLPYKLYNIKSNTPLPLMSFIEIIEDGDVLSSSKNVEEIINNINYKSNSNLINGLENNEAV